MEQRNKTIAVVSDDPLVHSSLQAALGTDASLKVTGLNATLPQINGKATELAASTDVIVFRTGAAASDDVEAIRAIRKGGGTHAAIIALSDDGILFSDARKLTDAGATDVLPISMNADDLRNSICKAMNVSNQIAFGSADSGRAGKILSVAQARGGIGSTTVAVNLADQLLDRRGMMKKVPTNSVALVDLDLQFGAISSFLDVQPNETLFQMAVEGTMPDATFLEQSMVKAENGVDVLSAPTGFAPVDSLRPEQVKSLLNVLRSKYDYVVVDLPRALVPWLSPVLEMSDRMCLVTDSAVPSVQQCLRLANFFTEDVPTLQIDLVVNHEKKPLVQSSHHKEASAILGRPLRYWLPHDENAAREAVDRGQPLSKAAGRSALTAALAKMGRQIAADLKENTAVATAKA